MPDTRVMQGSLDRPHILSTDAPASEVLARHHHDVEHGKRDLTWRCHETISKPFEFPI